MPAGHKTTQLSGVANLALMARVRRGFVEGFETITFARRLEALLAVLNALRLAARELVLEPSPFPDSVGRFGIIQSFRYAIVPPQAPGMDGAAAGDAGPGTYRLSLNVGFDGGWEPYLRVVYRDLGPLLDAIFCHCEGYPASHSHSMDEYTRWVRAHEIESGIYYTESAQTVVDQRYLSRVEQLQRESADLPAVDAAIAALAVGDPNAPPPAGGGRAGEVPMAAIRQGLRAVRGLHALRPYFPANAERDDACLLRLAQYALPEFHARVTGGLFDGAAVPEPLRLLARQFAHEIAWFRGDARREPVQPRELAFAPSMLQCGILGGDGAITHGALLLVHVADAARARAFLARTDLVTAHGDAGSERRYGNLGLTYAGLRALGVPARRLDDWPQEFIDGMEARAGLLGDLHANHPDRWQRPERNWVRGRLQRTGQRIELSSVHAVLQWRIAGGAAEVPDGELHPDLAKDVARLEAEHSGLTVMSVQTMRRLRDAQGNVVEHFGFRDGLSQPRVHDPAAPAPSPAPRHWDDRVRRGELVLGHPGDRDDRPYPAEADRLLDNGCFAAVRKIAQHVGRLDAVLAEQARPLARPGQDAAALQLALKERLMGRHADGRPMVDGAQDNDFDYRGDPQGAQCPFHSHVRRANPRAPAQRRRADGRLIDAGRPLPRLLRRGMTYGPAWPGRDDGAERGLVFIAYVASLAEQFEVVQRWISGGNSSGVGSQHNDPLLGVCAPGQSRRVYRWQGSDAGSGGKDGGSGGGYGGVVRVDLGVEPFTSLQWGLYLFMPSMDALRHLDDFAVEAGVAAIAAAPSAAPAAAPAPTAGAAGDLDAWRARLEDERLREAAWREVRAAPRGTVRTGYGTLHGCSRQVLAVLRDDGRRHSVRGYGERFRASIGTGYLGLDPHDGHARQAPAINAAIEAISAPDAYLAARRHADRLLEELRAFAQPGEGAPPRSETPIDIVRFSELVLARLCAEWFGLPDAQGLHMRAGPRPLDGAGGPVRCPGHYVSVSKLIFSPHPAGAVRHDGAAHGRDIGRATRAFLAEPSAAKGTLVQSIEQALEPLRAGHGDAAHAELVASTVAGVMLGFAPTVHGNFCALMLRWIERRLLWDLQLDLPLQRRGGAARPLSYRRAAKLFLGPMLAQMRAAPVPNLLWRMNTGAAGADAAPPGPSAGKSAREATGVPPVIVGLGSAVRDLLGDDSVEAAALAPPRFGMPPPAPARRRREAQANALLFGGPRRGARPATHACPGRPMATGVMLGMIASLMQAGNLRPTASPTTLMRVEPPLVAPR